MSPDARTDLVEVLLRVEEHLGEPVPLFPKELRIAIGKLVTHCGHLACRPHVESSRRYDLARSLFPLLHHVLLRPEHPAGCRVLNSVFSQQRFWLIGLRTGTIGREDATGKGIGVWISLLDEMSGQG